MGLPPRPRWPWHEPVSGWVWQARLGDVVGSARAGEHQPPALPLVKLGRTASGGLVSELGGLRRGHGRRDLRGAPRSSLVVASRASASRPSGGCEVVSVDASSPALEAVRAIHRRARAIAQGLAGTGWVSAFEARLEGGDASRFRPLVVFVGGDVSEDDVADIVEAAGRNRAITCVLSGAHARSDLELECRDGCVQVPFLSNLPVVLPSVESYAEDDDTSTEAVVAEDGVEQVELLDGDVFEDATLPEVTSEARCRGGSSPAGSGSCVGVDRGRGGFGAAWWEEHRAGGVSGVSSRGRVGGSDEGGVVAGS